MAIGGGNPRTDVSPDVPGSPAPARIGEMVQVGDAHVNRVIESESPNHFYTRHDLHLRFLYMDPKIAADLGLEEGAWRGKTHRELGFSEDRSAFFEEVLGRVRDSAKPAQVEFWTEGADGRSDFVASVYPELDGAGTVQSLVTITRDVTRRKKIEEELRRRDDRIRRINRNLVGSMIYQIVRERDGRRRFTYLGDNVEVFYGVSVEEAMADPSRIYGRIHEEDRERLHLEEEEAFRTLSTFKTEARVWTPQGGIRWSLFVSSPTRLEDGSTCWDGIELDITERKRAEDALRESEERFRRVFDLSPIGSVVVSPDFRFQRCNEAFCRFLGYEEEELLGKTFLEVTHPEDRPIGQEEIPAILAGRLDVATLEKRYLHKSGRPVWGLVTIRLVRDPQGAPVNFLSVVQDITAEKEAERAIQESEARFRVIAEAAFDGLMIHDRGLILDANQRLAELFGFQRPQELIGRHSVDILPLTEESRAGTLAQIASPRNDDFEFTILRPDGSIGVLEGRGRNFTYQGREVRAVTLRDITDRKRMEEERLTGQRLESIGVLAGGIAHDFNNILTGILGNLSISLLDLELGRTPIESLKAAENACCRARDLTRQLLTFSRGGAPVMKPASVREIVEESVSFVSRGSNVRCRTTFAADLHPGHLDAGQVGQVVHNLVLNAIQAMPRGGDVRIAAENIRLELGNALLLPGGDYVCITVADEGAGIAPEHLPRVFDPYFTTKEEGLGLGLATSYSIARRHGGKITAESEPGRGAVFRVYLPAAQTDVASQAIDQPATPRFKARILVMDDDETVRMVARRMLEQLGHTVVVAAEGAEAVKLYRTAVDTGRPFAAVIFDLTVPGGMGGKDALVEIRQFDPRVRAVVASGYSSDPVMANFSEHGFVGMVAKPFGRDELARALAVALEERATP